MFELFAEEGGEDEFMARNRSFTFTAVKRYISLVVIEFPEKHFSSMPACMVLPQYPR